MKPLLFILILFGTRLNAQCILKTVSLGDFKTVSGAEIKNCTIGYRTLGKLNAAKSNAVLWPTWFTGTSEVICKGVGPMILDTTGLFVIIVDALGNGVSSSPSNSNGFPEITIRDMVNSQHEFLIKFLGIAHLKAVMGVSMGGMQALEWSVSYPVFFDKAISIVGTPRQSVYDLILWKSEAAVLDSAARNGQSMETALTLVSNVHFMNLYSPTYWQHNSSPEKVDSLMHAARTGLSMKPVDFLSQLKAMISHDIFKSSGKTIAEIKDVIKAKTLFIVFKADHMVNPASSAELSQAIGARFVQLESDCGHMGVLCDNTHVREQVVNFLQE